MAPRGGRSALCLKDNLSSEQEFNDIWSAKAAFIKEKKGSNCTEHHQLDYDFLLQLVSLCEFQKNALDGNDFALAEECRVQATKDRDAFLELHPHFRPKWQLPYIKEQTFAGHFSTDSSSGKHVLLIGGYEPILHDNLYGVFMHDLHDASKDLCPDGNMDAVTLSHALEFYRINKDKYPWAPIGSFECMLQSKYVFYTTKLERLQRQKREAQASASQHGTLFLCFV